MTPEERARASKEYRDTLYVKGLCRACARRREDLDILACRACREKQNARKRERWRTEEAYRKAHALRNRLARERAKHKRETPPGGAGGVRGTECAGLRFLL